MIKKYVLYLLRWQLSSPVLAVFAWLISNSIIAAIVSNLVGGLIFFWVDLLIFRKGNSMKQYITFNKDMRGENGTEYIGGVNYRLHNEDNEFIYFGKDKVSKDNLNMSDYRIGEIVGD